MTGVPDITTGDYTSLAVTLRKNGETFVISPTAEVKVAIVSPDHKTVLTPAPVAQSSATPGADWAHSLVVVELPTDATSGITSHQGLAVLEIQVKENNKPKTWFLSVNIIRGNIA